jgi:hypothetical protein
MMGTASSAAVLSGPHSHEVALAATALLAACGSEDGIGTVAGDLDVANCWQGPFDLAPTFFAAAPFRRTAQLRIQRGSDFQTYADAVQILIDDIDAIRGTGKTPSKYGQPLRVALPAEVTPPGVPVVAEANPALVHMTVSLQQSCRTLNVALYALDGVAVNADGSCGRIAGDSDPCAKATENGRSSMTFRSLFNGDPTESNAAQRLNEASFDVYLGDPRDRCPDGRPRCLGHLSGSFSFYFQRSRPAQPFP